MNFIQKIFRTIWAVYGLIIFLICLFSYLPVFLIVISFFNENVVDRFVKLSYYLIPRLIFYPCGIGLKVLDEGKIDTDKNYVIVSNHQSVIDIFANPGSCRVPFKYLSKIEVKSMPLINLVANQYCVYVDRKNPESRKKSFQNLIDSVNNGYSILVYPEGTRNRTEMPLKEFYDGAFRLAITTQTPIIVQTLVNSNKRSSPIRKFDLSPGIIYCHNSMPVLTKGMTLNDISELKQTIRSIMMSHLTRK